MSRFSVLLVSLLVLLVVLTQLSAANYIVAEGNCYTSCKTNADCGYVTDSTSCNTCNNGQCGCPSGRVPCVNDEAQAPVHEYITYSCLNASLYVPCAKGVYGQPAGRCSVACKVGQTCCDAWQSSCYDASKEFCCDISVSLFPVTCQYGYRCAPDPVLQPYWAVCADINECSLSPPKCGSGYTCANSPGSYNCTDINECVKTPTICGSGYTCRNAVGTYYCDDINECEKNASLCGSLPCLNTPGSYLCDVDECAQTPSVCEQGFYCQNTLGSYTCNDVDECAITPPICGTGYTCTNTNGSHSCDDVDECTQTPNICGTGYTCTNTAGNYSCADVNECANNSTCAVGYSCQNTVGGYTCSDINECTVNATVCGSGYTCENSVGSYVCNDIDECQTAGICSIYSTCQNHVGNYSCDAFEFYIISALRGLALEPATDTSYVLTRVYVPGKRSQVWKYTEDKYIQHAETGKVFDIVGNIVIPDAKIILWDKKPLAQANNQRWNYDSSAKTFTTFAAANLVLDISNANSSPGAILIVYNLKPSDNDNQKFEFRRV